MIGNDGDYSVYTLSDPRTNEVRYVGLTRLPLTARLTQHLVDARGAGDGAASCDRWIAELLAKHTRPVITLVEETKDRSRKAHWIDTLTSSGHHLVNTYGGSWGNRRRTTMGPVTMPEEKLLTVDEVARLMRSNPETVRRWLRTHQLAGIRLGKSWLVKPSDLDAFLAERYQDRTQG